MYWAGEHLLDQIINKTLSIAQTIYPGYEMLLMFDNAISLSIYVKNSLYMAHINK